MLWLLLGWFCLGEPRVTIRLQPSIVMRGEAVRIWCRVPKHPGNRHLWLDLDSVRRSYRQLDGEAAPTLYDLVVDDVPCLYTSADGQAALSASCELQDNMERTWVTSARLIVAGCSSPVSASS